MVQYKQRLETPSWALRLAREVADSHNKKHLPEIVFIEKTLRTKAGHYEGWKQKRIVVFGKGYLKENDYSKSILLHELAHWLTFRRKNKVWHSKKFYKAAFALYDKYKISEKIQQAEFGYKKRSREVYFQLRGQDPYEGYKMVKAVCKTCGVVKDVRVSSENPDRVHYEHLNYTKGGKQENVRLDRNSVFMINHTLTSHRPTWTEKGERIWQDHWLETPQDRSDLEKRIQQKKYEHWIGGEHNDR